MKRQTVIVEVYGIDFRMSVLATGWATLLNIPLLGENNNGLWAVNGFIL